VSPEIFARDSSGGLFPLRESFVMTTAVVFFNFVLLMAPVAPATMLDTRGLIEQALDEPTRIVLGDVQLGEAFDLVTQQTGVNIVMSSEVMALAPYGAATKVSAEIANIPLRQGLTDLVSQLGMTFEVRDDHVEVVPKAALSNLGRPASWAELDTLAALVDLQPGADEADLETLRGKVRLDVPIPDAWGVLSAAIRNAGAGPGDESLTVACGHLGWSWLLSGDRIVVSPREHQLRSRLAAPIELRLNNTPLFDVLRLIGRSVGVSVRAEPGALQALPVQTQRSFSVNITRQTAEEAFDTICAYTGLAYLIDPDGVLFYLPEHLRKKLSEVSSASATQSSGRSRPSDPYVAKIVVPLDNDQTVEWLVRASELPDDLLGRREHDIAAFVEAVRRAGGDANP